MADARRVYPVILSGGDTAATIQAAARGTSGVNAAMVYGTDGGVGATGLSSRCLTTTWGT